MINGKYQRPSPTEHDGFDDSRFEQGEEVEVALRHPQHGGEMGRATGTLIMRNTNVDVSRDGQESFHKNLVQLRGLEINETGEQYKNGEAWFAEEALRKKEGDLLDDVSFN